MKTKELLAKYKAMLNEKTIEQERFRKERDAISYAMEPNRIEIEQLESFIAELEQMIADELPKKPGRKPGSKNAKKAKKDEPTEAELNDQNVNAEL
jgi:hypothetical protein